MTGYTPPEEQALIETYGPWYQHADVQRGEQLRYKLNGFTYRGTCLWVQGPETIGSHRLPMRYVVSCDMAEDGGKPNTFVDVIFRTDLVRDEPT